MGEIGLGNGSSYPAAFDENNTPEVDSPALGKTLARKDVPEDLAACIIAIETELGTDPAGTKTDVKTYLQTAHSTAGKHQFSAGTVTTNDPVWNSAQTWNAAGVTFVAMEVDITNTASAEYSLLLNLEVGGATKFSVDKRGRFGDGQITPATLNLDTLEPIYNEMWEATAASAAAAGNNGLYFLSGATGTRAQVANLSVVNFLTGITSGSHAGFQAYDDAVAQLSSAEWIFKCKCDTATLGTTQKRWILGFSDDNDNSTHAAAGAGHGVFFRIEEAGTVQNIFAVNKNGISTETTTDSTVVDSSTPHIFEIRVTSTTARFYIDGTNFAIQTTNLPTGVDLKAHGTMRTLDVNDKNWSVDFVQIAFPRRTF